MPDCDSLYHRFFRNPIMVEHLVRAFLRAVMAAGVDFTRMELVPAKYHSGKKGRGRERAGDIVWRLPTHHGTDIYLYLLFEFQSRVHWWMALRALVYQGLLLQQIVAEKRLKRGARLPPVFTIVLYNGRRRWNAPTDVAGLLNLPEGSPLWPWQPRVRYYPLDMAVVPKGELGPKDNLATLLVRLERRQSKKEYLAVIDDVIDWFRRHPDHDELERLFTELVRQGIEDSDANIPIPRELQEVKTMFPGIEWMRKGRTKGRREGEKESRKTILLRQLHRRFGTLPSYVDSLVNGAESKQLDLWLDAIIDAPTLEAIFGDPIN